MMADQNKNIKMDMDEYNRILEDYGTFLEVVKVNNTLTDSISELESENARLVTELADTKFLLGRTQKREAECEEDIRTLQAENARLQEIAETERQNATTAEAQAGKWKVAYENARAREDQYFQWVSDLCDYVDNDIVMQITGISMPRNTTPPEPEARYKVADIVSYQWGASYRHGVIVDSITRNGKTVYTLADNSFINLRESDIVRKLSDARLEEDSPNVAPWLKPDKRADELNASDS